MNTIFKKGGGLRIEVVRDRKKKSWYFKIIAGNGKILCHSEQYTQRGGCLAAVHRIMDTINWKLEEIEK